MEWWDTLREVRMRRRQVLKAAAAASAVAALSPARLVSVLAQARVMTLDYFTLFHSGDAAAMERIVRAFNEAHATVKLNLLQGQWAEYYAQLFAAVGAGNPPQIGICHSSRIMDVYRALTPLEESRTGDLLQAAGIRAADYTASVWNAGIYQGKRYLVPLDSHMWGLWYNKDLFRRAGLDPEKAPETREEFERAADAIKARTSAFAFHPAEDALPRKIRRAWEILFWGQGGELLTADGRRAAFNNDRGIGALDYLVGMIHRKGWNQPGTDGFKQFAAGQLGMLLAGNWYFPTAKESGVNFGFHYVPKFFERPTLYGPRDSVHTCWEMIDDSCSLGQVGHSCLKVDAASVLFSDDVSCRYHAKALLLWNKAESYGGVSTTSTDVIAERKEPISSAFIDIECVAGYVQMS